MRLLPFQIRTGNQRARLAQPKGPLPKQTLALTHPQINLETLLSPRTQGFPLPQRAGQAPVERILAHCPVHLSQLRLAQMPRTPRALALGQSGQTLRLKAPNPVLHRARRVSEQAADQWTGRALGHQQYSMQPAIIPRFFRTASLVLQSQNQGFGISDLRWFHTSLKPETAGL